MYRINKKEGMLHQSIYDHLLSTFNKPSSSYYKAHEWNTSGQDILSGKGSFEVKCEWEMQGWQDLTRFRYRNTDRKL